LRKKCATVEANMKTTQESGPVTKFVGTPYGRIALEIRGAGPTLVLLHAAGHDRHDFDAIVAPLARDYQVLTVDWPGHGESDLAGPPEQVSAPMLADALEELLKRLEISEAVFIGNSVGGFAAARLAIRCPQRVRALVLVDSGGFNEPSFGARAFCRLKGTEFVTARLWNAFPAHYLKKRNRHVRAILQRVRAAESESAIRVNAAVWRSFTLAEHDLRAAARSIRVPTLIVWGSDDPVITLDRGRLAAEIIPEARLLTLATGHVPFAEDPEGFLTAVRPFLEALPSVERDHE
jgi:pimeloyl-ACP methyl ester carboxylesterase